VAILCASYAGVALKRYRVDVRDAAESGRFAGLLIAALERCGYAPDAIVNAEVVLAELVGNLVRIRRVRPRSLSTRASATSCCTRSTTARATGFSRAYRPTR